MVVCGVDEVGRGSLAGPVYAACVILPEHFPVEILADSKKLTPKKREAVLRVILQECLWSFGQASAQEVDEINILQATFKAMHRAFRHLHHNVDTVLIDGNQNPHLPVKSSQTIIKGDAKEPCIMAASIVAKCFRDYYMRKIDPLFPCYQFAQNKGYGTLQHRRAILKYGPSSCHRKTFLKNYI